MSLGYVMYFSFFVLQKSAGTRIRLKNSLCSLPLFSIDIFLFLRNDVFKNRVPQT